MLDDEIKLKYDAPHENYTRQNMKMRINTKKIRVEMERVGMTMEDLGKLLKPPRTRQGACFIVQHGRSFTSIEQLAKVLYLDPKDLII